MPLPFFPTSRLCPFRCWFPGGWACICSMMLWAPPMDSPVRLGVSPTAATPTGFYIQRFWGFISPCWNPGLQGLSPLQLFLPVYLHANVGPPGLPATALPLVLSVPCCPFLTLLPVWMNVSSLTPWLSDFHVVWFSVSSSCFFFLNWLLSFFWLCEEAKHIYLHLHLGWNLRI